MRWRSSPRDPMPADFSTLLLRGCLYVKSETYRRDR
ncbi:MAG: hypothetical protein JWO67_1502 [Streptosporangiaceae bacterium]|nr:hypothetical protein [Streptosporangiaceae bacterium]